jgi:hypothetical protein
MSQSTNPRFGGMKSATPLRCDGCRTTEKVIRYPSRNNDPLCPKCSSLYDRYDAASANLREYLASAMHPWMVHWKNRGLTLQEIGEVLGLEAGELAAEYERIAREGAEGESDDA